jgi:hypothetical protein
LNKKNNTNDNGGIKYKKTAHKDKDELLATPLVSNNANTSQSNNNISTSSNNSSTY